MRSFLLSVAVLIVTLAVNVGIAEENELDADCKLIEASGNQDQKSVLARWQAATHPVVWKDASGDHTTSARYIGSDESWVKLEKDDGTMIRVQCDRLDFNGKVRVKRIGELKNLLYDAASAIQVKKAADKKRQAAEESRQKWLGSLSPEEKRIRQRAKDMSDAGDTFSRGPLAQARVGNDLQFRVMIGSGGKLMDRFVAEYKTGSLTADNVKRAINEAGGSGGAIQYLNLWYFSKESLESGAPFVLVDADRLITLADVYNAARRSLPPEVRQAYGFAHIDIFDRLGNKCYWEYMLEQEMKAKRQGGARSDRANVSNQ